MTHNWARQRPLFAAWAELIAELLGSGGFRLLIADLGRLDWESIAVLKEVYRRRERSAIDLDIGWSPSESPPSPDADGIVWTLPRSYLARTVLDFLSITESRRIDTPLPADPAALDANDLARLYPEPDAGLEGHAFTILSADRGPLSADDSELVLSAVEAAFLRFGFASALRLGRELAARCPQLGPPQRATLHGLVALSAHNLQFHAGGNLPLAGFIGKHLRAALALEVRPVHRAALLYRMAVTLGRRESSFAAAEAAASEALEVAPSLPPAAAAYQEAWTRNIRAYARARTGRSLAAASDLALGLKQLAAVDAAEDGPSRPTPREIAFTQALIATNLATLASAAGDAPAALYWRGIAYELERRRSGRGRHEAAAWIDSCRTLHLPRLALPKALRGWASARRDNDGALLHRFALESADLSYRLGRLPEALRWYRRAHRLREAAGRLASLPCAAADIGVVCGRAGFVREAVALLREASFEQRSLPDQVTIQTRLAIATARCEEPEAAEKARQRALNLVERSDSESLRLHTLAVSGHVLRLLGKEEGAKQALSKAIALIPEDSQALEVPGDALRALIDFAETGGGSLTALRALSLVPTALVESETWWLLGRLLGVLTGVEELVDKLREAADTEPLRLLLLASGQRPDCAEVRAQFMSRLPDEVLPKQSRLADYVAMFPTLTAHDPFANAGPRPWAWACEA